MYSVVLMAALAGSGGAPDSWCCKAHGSNGYGYYGGPAYNCYGAYGGSYYGIPGGGYGCNGCIGCYGGNWGRPRMVTHWGLDASSVEAALAILRQSV